MLGSFVAMQGIILIFILFISQS